MHQNCDPTVPAAFFPALRARPALAPSPNLGMAVRGVMRREGRVVVTLGRTGRWLTGTCTIDRQHKSGSASLTMSHPGFGLSRGMQSKLNISKAQCCLVALVRSRSPLIRLDCTIGTNGCQTLLRPALTCSGMLTCGSGCSAPYGCCATPGGCTGAALGAPKAPAYTQQGTASFRALSCHRSKSSGTSIAFSQSHLVGRLHSSKERASERFYSLCHLKSSKRTEREQIYPP